MRVFLDTNVVAYALDARETKKRERATHLLRTHSGNLVISTQILIELFNVCRRSLKMSQPAARARVNDASRLEVVSADRELVAAATEIVTDSGLSIYDAMVVAAAQRGACDVLFTEDQALLDAELSLATENPFA